MRFFNQTYLDDILKFVNKYYQENRKAPTIIQVSTGVGVPPFNYAPISAGVEQQRLA